MFDGFVLERIDVGEAELRVRHGGSGPPLLLLHGHPRTHVTWHRVAPLLAHGHTVVCPDLRGYGESSKPRTTPDHEPYSKRAMARGLRRVDACLGHDRFAVAGHDRGSYVAFRLAIDHPDIATHLVVMDGVPIGEALARADARFAALWWHWFFLGQTAKPAERVISADPTLGTRSTASRWAQRPTPTYGSPYTTPKRCMQCARTTAQVSESTGPTTTLTDARDDASGVQLSSSGRHATTWATLYRDPVSVWHDWLLDVRDGVPSRADTTWQRKPRTNLRKPSASSSQTPTRGTKRAHKKRGEPNPLGRHGAKGSLAERALCTIVEFVSVSLQSAVLSLESIRDSALSARSPGSEPVGGKYTPDVRTSELSSYRKGPWATLGFNNSCWSVGSSGFWTLALHHLPRSSSSFGRV